MILEIDKFKEKVFFSLVFSLVIEYFLDLEKELQKRFKKCQKMLLMETP